MHIDALTIKVLKNMWGTKIWVKKRLGFCHDLFGP